MTARLRAWRLLLAAAWRADRRRAVLVPLVALVAGLTAAGYGLTMKWLVDAAVGGVPVTVVLTALALAGAVVLGSVTGILAARMRVAMQQRVALTVDRHLIELSTGLPDVSHHEDPAYQDRMELLRQQRGTIASAYSAMVDNLRGLTRLVAVSALIGSLDGILLLLPLCALPAVLVAGAGQRVQRRTEERCAERDRRRRRLLALGSSSAAAGELRCYRLDGPLRRRHRSLQAGVDTEKQRADVVTQLLAILGWLVFGAALLGAVALVLLRIRQGEATAGDLALLLTVGTQLEGALTVAVNGVSWLLRTARAVGHYRWLVDRVAAVDRSPGPTGAPPTGSGDLVLEHVSFTYPGTTEPVLRDVSLTLPAGITVAVVGENGAGKTTLVKLLCRLYQPTEGTLRYGDVDLATLTPEAWRARISVGFQDFCRFELTARQSVGVGDLSRVDDRNAVRAAADSMRVTALLDALPAGLETQLGRSFENGVELSTGQWQALALARAAMRDRPALRILDEPTSSLDPDAEHALFAHQAARAVENPDTITVFVSHRFSTVRAADLIVVLDSGRVTEAGTHDELMAADGYYADLYTLHATGYTI